MSVSSSELISEKECTPRCHSQEHAALLLSCATKGSSSEIRSYCSWLCHNFGTITDNLGRNILHLAASTGKWEMVDWLIDRCHCNVDVRDHESGWTALHRSLYYGQIQAARILLNHGASLRAIDRECLTPLDLLIEDRLPFIEYNAAYPQDVYVWGSNTNFNLGIGDEQSRAYPEILDVSQKGYSNIKQVVMCKFHTVFLSVDGNVLTCGCGHGGRLGQGSEVTQLTPSPVQGLGEAFCEMVAAGNDHLILLMRGGQVWSCGSNIYHQLGHSPPPECLVKPKPISLKFLKGTEIMGVCAARFHSVFYTKTSVYTFGLNAGQLGHPKGPRTYMLPHQVSGVYNKDWEITHVAASDGATVCATSRGDVYVLHEFQHRKIASRQEAIRKLSVVGGSLDSSCNAAGVRENGGLELRVILLTKSGKLFLWRQSNPYLRRCLFTSGRQLFISDVHLSHDFVAMITLNNQGYLGTILPFKEKRTIESPTNIKSRGMNQLNQLLDPDECDFIRAKRLPHVHRATFITSDCKGRNFAVLQNSPKVGLLEFPAISPSCIRKDFKRLLDESCIEDCIHDLIIQVGSKEYAVHKYILASRCEYFKKRLLNLNSSSEKTKLALENIVPQAFEQILQYLYCNSCDFLVDGKEVVWPGEARVDHHTKANEVKTSKGVSKKKSKKCIKDGQVDPLKCMQQACKQLNLSNLCKGLEAVKLVNGRINVPFPCELPPFKFNYSKSLYFYDVCLRSSEEVEFPCHKCVLVARSEYFHGMLGSSFWFEKMHLESLSLPFPSTILKILLHYFYSDANYVSELENVELLCQILAVADQLLVVRLKNMCEVALVSLLTLKNAPELLQLSCIYNATQLKLSCMEFICVNLPSMIEARNLDVISDETMEELSRMYRNMVPRMRHRFITPYLDPPDKVELQNIEKCFPVDQDSEFIQKSEPMKSNENKPKSRRRLKSQNVELEVTETPVNQSRPPVKDVSSDDIIVNPTSPKLNQAVKQERLINSSDGHLTSHKLGQWVLTCPNREDVMSLSQIMEKEKLVLQNESNSHSKFKRLPHLSQKQKKQLATNPNHVAATAVSPGNNSLRSTSKCPWANISEPSTGFAIPNREETSPQKGICGNFVPPSTPSFLASSPPLFQEPLVISLQEIQKEEEEKELHQAVQPKVKPLHIINIEDQAIEELLALYKVDNNPDERITVSRVLPECTARPVWKKNATVPILSP